MATAISFEHALRPVSRVLVYNPGDRFEWQVAGETYDFPARDERFVDVLVFKGKDRRLSADERAYLESLQPGVRPIVDTVTGKNGTESGRHEQRKMPTEEILENLLGDSGRNGPIAEWGVRILLGDERDARIIKEANDTYHKKLMAYAVAATMAHRTQNEKYKAAGIPPAAPTERLLKLYQIEADMRRGGAGIPCDICYLPVSNKEEMAKHKVEFHAIDLKAAPEPSTIEEAGELIEPVKRGPGRPRKVAE